MNRTTLKTRFKRLYLRLNGCTIEYDLSPYQAVLKEINAREPVVSNKTDHQLRQMAQILKSGVNKDQTSDQLLIEVFALVRETARRVLKVRAFDEQLLGAIAMQQDKLIEMQTGEGKTLTAVFPACLNALNGSRVHILTFNDYLARRDAQWMGPIYTFLDMQAGFIQQGMTIQERQKAYAADITYVTAKEAGFDYLRDSLTYEQQNLVQPEFDFAIIDEADSILIDEARIPLVIAGAADDFIAHIHNLSGLVRQLKKGTDFEFDEYSRDIHLTDYGQKHIEKILQCGNLYNSENYELLTRLHCALHAEYLLQCDVDYIVRQGKIELVDEFTGRVADKRRWPDGLQAALEAKENTDVQAKGNILSSITLQHFVHFYPRLCGMTATAQEAEEEFQAFYNLNIVVIPPHQECIRFDQHDVIFRSKTEKDRALADEIIETHKTGRPILVGTRSVEESAKLAETLQQQGVSCDILNAKRDEYEAQIIAQAGKLGAVTISTNMAGRGTDIRLGGSDEKEKAQVVKLGGLYVIGTNRHESKRIDRQLRGRAGRQGDPGSSRFFISLEDDLFIKYRLAELLPEYVMNTAQSGEIDNPVIRSEVARVQRICEGQNLEIKKTLCKYSDLIEKQRMVLYNRRRDILLDQEAVDFFSIQSAEKFQQVSAVLNHEDVQHLCRWISLYHIDSGWSLYLAEIADIRESIHLKRIGGQDPFIEFQKLAIKIFDEQMVHLDEQLIRTFNSLPVDNHFPDLEKLGLKTPTATWTYLVNDNPFEHNLGMQLIGNAGLQIGAGILGPLVALQLMFRKNKSDLK
jgi:preprotein translocase subunit SecA